MGARGKNNPLVCAYSEYLSDFEIKPGLVRNVSLCFLPDVNGDIIYFSAVEEKKYLQKVESAIAQARAAGELDDARELAIEAARTRIGINRFREAGMETVMGDQLDAGGYIASRVAHFAAGPEPIPANEIPEIEREILRLDRMAFIGHLTDVLPITAYFIGGFWIVSFVIGWIVRGFAGIPIGQDFRPAPKNMSSS